MYEMSSFYFHVTILHWRCLLLVLPNYLRDKLSLLPFGNIALALLQCLLLVIKSFLEIFACLVRNAVPLHRYDTRVEHIDG